MLCDGAVVESRTGGYGDRRGVETSGEDVVGAGGEGLDPAEVGEGGFGEGEVGGGVGPGDEDGCIEEVGGDGIGARIVGVKGDGRGGGEEGGVEREGGGVEDLHFGGWGV